MAQIVGLDLGARGIRAILLDSHKLVKVQEYSLASNTDSQKLLKDLFGGKGFPKNHVWIAVNDRECLARDMRVPFTNEDQIQQTIRFSSEAVISDDIDEYLLDFKTIEVEEAETHLMIVAARREEVGRKLRLLQEVGVDPDGVSFSGLALYNLGASVARKEEMEEPFLILDVGASTADIIVGDQESFRFIRSILIHRSEKTEDECKILDEARLDRLFKEVKRTLWSGGVDGHAEVIWLCGGIAHMPGIENKVSQTFEIPAKILPVEQAFDQVPDNVDHLGPFAQAAGLALMGGEKVSFPNNFRREEFVRQPKLLKVRWPMIFLLLLLMGAVFWDGWLTLKSLKAQRLQLASHLGWERQQFSDFWGPEELPSELQMSADPRWLLQEFESRSGKLSRSLKVHPDALETFYFVVSHFEKFQQFELLELDIGPTTVKFRGRLPNQEQLQRLEEDLLKSDQKAFSNVELRSPNIKDDGTVEFNITLSLNKKET